VAHGRSFLCLTAAVGLDPFLGDEERRLMDLVPALAVRLMKRRVLSRPGGYSLLLSFLPPGRDSSFQDKGINLDDGRRSTYF
jgi:hypothetical protein